VTQVSFSGVVFQLKLSLWELAIGMYEWKFVNDGADVGA
jgi:hypothetical protein